MLDAILTFEVCSYLRHLWRSRQERLHTQLNTQRHEQGIPPCVSNWESLGDKKSKSRGCALEKSYGPPTTGTTWAGLEKWSASHVSQLRASSRGVVGHSGFNTDQHNHDNHCDFHHDNDHHHMCQLFVASLRTDQLNQQD